MNLMKYKLIICIISFVMVLLTGLFIFIANQQDSLLNIQIPLLIAFIYLSTSFGASYFFDRIKLRAIEKNKQNINPYKPLIQFMPAINIFIFGFFGLMTLIEIITLIVLFSS